VDCLECKRLRKAYAEATKRSTELLAQIAGNVKITGTRGGLSEASKAIDAEWTAARESLYAHIRTHSKEGK